HCCCSILRSGGGISGRDLPTRCLHRPGGGGENHRRGAGGGEEVTTRQFAGPHSTQPSRTSQPSFLEFCPGKLPDVSVSFCIGRQNRRLCTRVPLRRTFVVFRFFR